MIEPTLHLEAYEVVPERCSDRDGEPFFFRTRWFGKEREFIGQPLSANEYAYYLWFSLPDGPERGNFVCSNPSVSAFAPHMEFWTESSLQRIVDHIGKGFWGRLFVLDSSFQLADGENGCCIVFLASSGWGHVHFLHHGFAEFEWAVPCASMLAEPSPVRHLGKVLALAEQPEHTIHFAFQWARMSKRERLALVLPLTKGDYEQWQRLIRLHAIATLSHQEGWRSYHEVSLVSQAGSTWTLSEQNWYQTGSLAERRTENKSFQRFVRWTRAYFQPVRNEELCAAYPCVRSWVQRKPKLSSDHIEPPTEHERLEALVQLREWLADKATPAEIEELRRED